MPNTNFWTIFYLMEAFFAACFGSFILSRGAKDYSHFLFFLVWISISLRCIAEFGFTYTDENNLWFWQKIDALWAFTPALFLHFSLIYTKRQLNLRKLILFIIYLPSFFFAISESFHFIEVLYIKTYYGYELAYANMPLYTILSLTWGNLYCLISIFILAIYWKRVADDQLKKRLRLLFWMMVSFLLCTFILDHFLKILKIYLPSTTETYFIIGACFISYGIIKYDLFSPEKETAKKIKDLQAIYFLKNTSVGIIHEMKNKFFALVSKVDLLRRHTRECENPGCLRVIGLMRDNARDINEFINKILLYVKQEGEPFYNFNLAALIEEAIDSIGSLVPQGLTIRREFSDSLPIYCNANDLKSVVVNLLLNAFDAVNDGSGEVYIGTQKAVIKNREYSRLTVKDNGKGIAQEHLDSVFELMYTTKQEGSGFGLFFVKKIIEKYRGIIEVQSEPGRGTTFEIYLPLRGKA